MATKSTSSGGIGITGALFIVFIVLKLAKVGAVADWSWWWVTSPLWIPLSLFLVVMLIYAIIKTFSKY